VKNSAQHRIVGAQRCETWLRRPDPQCGTRVRPAGVRVNCICSGIIGTPLVARAFGATEEIRETMHRLHPLGRIGNLAEIAKMCALPRF
jgi:NAD(P)-dependent dehydrogenase (short-subunit alcohol dehydrogenase family)